MPKFVWDINPEIFRLGPFELFGTELNPALRYYSLLFVGVFLGGYSLLRWQVVRGGGDEEDAADFIIYGVIGVLAGSRLGHVLFYDFEHALRDPMWVLRIWEGGLASHGATLGLIVAMWYFTRKKGVTWLEGADRFAFSAALGATLVRAGNFFNSEIVGRVTDQTWGVKFPIFEEKTNGIVELAEVPYRHPSQLYEVAIGVIVFLALVIIDRRAGKEDRPRGLLIFSFFGLYFTGRFIVEFFKEYQTLDDESLFTMGQLLSMPGILLGYLGARWSLNKRLPVGWPEPLGSARADEDEDEEDEDYDEDEEDEDYEGDPDIDEEFARPSKKGARKVKTSKKRAEPDEDDEDDDGDEDEEEEGDDESGSEDEEEEEEGDDESGSEDEEEDDASRGDDEDDEDDEDAKKR